MFNIMPMVTSSLTGTIGARPILSIKLPVTIDTMLNFDGDGHGGGVGMCKQTFTQQKNTVITEQLSAILKNIFNAIAFKISCSLTHPEISLWSVFQISRTQPANLLEIE